MLKQWMWGAGAIIASVYGVANAQNLVVVSYGGANKIAQEKAFYKPFTQKTQIPVIGTEWSGEIAKVKAMVNTKTVSWDVVEVDSTMAVRGCEEGLFEKLDPKLVKSSDFIPGTILPCGIGLFLSATALAYNADKLQTPPTGWADFWDLKKFPGKRALRRGPQYTLEIALMADGVAPSDVYKVLSTPAGVDRAFKKLDKIKPYIQWWEAGSQPPLYLLSGDVVMSSSYNGRITSAQQQGKNLKMVWDKNINEFDYWVIPKGSKNLENAKKFIQFASEPQAQKVFSENIAYGAPNVKAMELISDKVKANLPSSPQYLKSGLRLDMDFWIDHGESLEERFNAWVAK